MRRTHLALLLTVALASNTPLRADAYFVDGKTGRDIPSAGTSAAPWKSLRYALLRVPDPRPLSFHTIWVAGDQDYVVDETLQLRDRIGVIGTGAVRPRFVSGRADVLFSARTDGALTLGKVRCHAQTNAIAISSETSPRIWIVEDCELTSDNAAALRVSGTSGTAAILEVRRCRFAGGKDGFDIDVGGTAVVNLRLRHTSFSRNAIAHRISTRGDARVSANIAACVFETCSKGVFLENASTHPTEVAVRRCAFRDCSGYGVEARPTGPSNYRVEQSSFVGGGTGVLLWSKTAGAASTIRLARNHGLGMTVGANLVLDVAPTNVGDWIIDLDSNRWEQAVTGLAFFAYPNARGTCVARAESIRASRSIGVAATNRSSLASFELQNSIVAGSGNVGLSLIGNGPIRGRFLTLVDHRSRALNATLATRASFDHCVLDNTANPEIVLGRATIQWSCSRQRLYPGTGNRRANPGLMRPSYKLSPSSPCIDNGDPNATLPKLDYEGDPRLVRTNRDVADIGADEYRPQGSVRVFGTGGFAVQDIYPSTEVISEEARIGTTVTLGLVGALDVNRPYAVLWFGSGEMTPAVDLAPVGATGSFLYLRPKVFTQRFSTLTGGKARARFAIPNDQTLVGMLATAQWLVAVPTRNPLGFITSDTFRITIGR